MVKSELDMLQSFIDELSGALSASPQDEECLYDLLNRANALYGDYVPEIAEQREEIMQFHGLLSRNCNAILALLKRELIKQTDNFEAGIMPLTYSQLFVCPAAQTVYKSGITKYDFFCCTCRRNGCSIFHWNPSRGVHDWQLYRLCYWIIRL